VRIGVLQTGHVPEHLIGEHGDYDQIFFRMLRDADPDLELVNYAVVDEQLPQSPTDCDGWVITGSRHGVYDDLPWIAPLKEFLRAARAARVPVAGVCFGHQIMAEAFGGRAVKSDKGWGLGVQDYQVSHKGGLSGLAPSYRGYAMHQDQVVEIPDDATLLASSPFCEFAALSYGDPETPDAISVQTHPEFSVGYAEALLQKRPNGVIPDELREAALKTIGRPVDNGEIARWFVKYMRAAHARRTAA